ncbi:hypothetical protein D3C86_1975350 [compost metagenome]
MVSEITWLSTDTSTSPGFTPALSAGPPWTTAAISAPSLALSPNDSAISGVRSCGSTPIQPRVTVPDEMIDSITCLAVETGIAKPIPSEPPERE